MKLDTTFKN